MRGAALNRLFGERWVAVAVAVELGTGLLLIIRPSLMARLLLGAELSAPGSALGRFTGIALFALALACWPRGDAEGGPALWAMSFFSAFTTLYLASLGVAGGVGGILLWPAVVLHGALTILLSQAWLKGKSGPLTRDLGGMKR